MIVWSTPCAGAKLERGYFLDRRCRGKAEKRIGHCLIHDPDRMGRRCGHPRKVTRSYALLCGRRVRTDGDRCLAHRGEPPVLGPIGARESIGEYLEVKRQEGAPGRKTHRWKVSNKSGAGLGTILWYTPWRQYTFRPYALTIFNRACLENITAFLGRLRGMKHD